LHVTDCINDNWLYITKKCVTEKRIYIRVRFILNLIYFTFDNSMYKQNFGISMDSPSLIIAGDAKIRTKRIGTV